MKQVLFRFWYLIRNIFSVPAYGPKKVHAFPESRFDRLGPFPHGSGIPGKGNCFDFLNIRHCFEDEIDWNFTGHGKLWLYNLNYFDFINQPDIDPLYSKKLIDSFTGSLRPGHTGLEPYPLSLRGVNLIKYMIGNRLYDRALIESLYGQYKLLLKNIEYHIMGNHLLENGLSLYAGGLFFDDKKMVETGSKILYNELDEQILEDGAHFELSPMYHQLILGRILDLVNIAGRCRDKPVIPDTFQLLKQKAGIMLGWLDNMTLNDGNVPNFNDSIYGISLSTSKLNSYACSVELDKISVPLGRSGYRRFSKGSYDCIIDAGNIGPDYQPGHSHSDTFSYVLYEGDRPVIVDTGISTYEVNQRRLAERSTSAHNTFQLRGVEQSEVWSSFRVARRAYCTVIEETSSGLKARHTGYRYAGIIAERSFVFRDREIVIEDRLNNSVGDSYIHFHPDIKFDISGNIVTSELFDIVFDGNDSIEKCYFQFSEGFNKLKPSEMVAIGFKDSFNYRIIFK